MNGKIINWMNQQDLPKSGSITIFKDAEQSKELKKIEFENFDIKLNKVFNDIVITKNPLLDLLIEFLQCTYIDIPIHFKIDPLAKVSSKSS